MLRRVLVSGALFTLPIVAVAACYGPTEMRIVLSTNVVCSSKPSTGIYKGFPFEGEPSAVTQSCTPGPSEQLIGDLVFIPSGSRDGRAGVKVVLATGSDATTCQTNPASCIIATRSFSYVTHLSRRLPITLLEECRGQVCPDGQTCVAGRRCVVDHVDCNGKDCALPDERTDGGVPSDGGGADGASDSGLLPAGPCTAIDGTPKVITTIDGDIPAPTLAAFDGNAFYFVRMADPQTVLAVKAAGGQAVPVTIANPTGAVLVQNALATLPGGAAAAFDALPDTSVTLHTPGADVPLGTGNPATALAVTPDATNGGVYVARQSTIDFVAGSPSPSVHPFHPTGGAAQIAVDDAFVYAATPGGDAIVTIDRTTQMVVSEFPVSVDLQARLFGRAGNAVVVAAVANQKPILARLTGSGPPSKIFSPTDPVSSVTADKTYVYWTDKNGIWRLARDGSDLPPKQMLDRGDGEKLGHVEVTDQCIYAWVKRGGSSVLISTTKPN